MSARPSPVARIPSATAITSATPQDAAKAFRSSRPAAAPAPSDARRIEDSERHERAGARDGGDEDERARGAPEARMKRRRQRADPQDERKRERDRAEGPDAAVAHDLELLRSRRATAEAIGRVGEPVLMQPAGRGDERRRRQRRAEELRQAKPVSDGEDGRPDEADDGAGDGRGPGEPVDVERGSVVARQRQTGKEPQRVGDVAGARREALVRRQSAHRNMATAAIPMAAKTDSMTPHWRTSARAAETSRPLSARIWLLSGAMTKNA